MRLFADKEILLIRLQPLLGLEDFSTIGMTIP